ncbi:PIN domain-containing protein [Pyrococcus kukulkanii]|uniref:PIN domain-containing protein n=1 Tax=Pyrococcus kukulkanii TaxID=1609559 RepID=A0A127BA72_9EURY|nr:PIN domain-containing protein [Pyrococcus kukulkanii]AMM54228.1 hypothetical protein TQ32_06890 [Pyrococcus kukulkanii]
MKVVPDYNVVFSALHNRGTAQELFVKNHISRTFEFLVPDYFWEELKRLHTKLVKITRLSHEEVEFLLEKIREQIITIDREVYEDFLEEAKRICPNPKDVPYVALAMATATPILIGDKKLTIKDKVKILPLNEAVRMV